MIILGKKRGNTVLSLGRINWKKGFDTLISAFKEVLKEKPQAQLIIAGNDDGHLEKVKELLDEFQIGHRVCLFGYADNIDKKMLYGWSDVFVMPSISENFGLTALESIAHGTPAIVTRECGIATDIKRFGIGKVINKSILELKDAIMAYLD